MVEYFTPCQYSIHKLWFYSQSIRYEGSGFMEWKSESGFRLIAKIEASHLPLNEVSLPLLAVPKMYNIRMLLSDGRKAYAPSVDSITEVDITKGIVSITVQRVLFWDVVNDLDATDAWSGRALIETPTKLILPDVLNTEGHLGSHHISASIRALEHSDANQSVLGQSLGERYIELTWRLEPHVWTRAMSGRYAEAFQDALSLVAGEVMQLRYQRMRRRNRIIKEMRANYPTGHINFTLKCFSERLLDKQKILRLTRFLAVKSKERDICVNILHQTFAASEQYTSQATELLSATILEAILRSLYEQPFSENENNRTSTFSLEGRLKHFRDQYLSGSVAQGRAWKAVTKKIIDAQRRLRDRNAHPDWLTSQGGSYSEEKMVKATDDLILISRFYGYMILALAGFEDLEPVFPVSLKDWKPVVTISKRRLSK